MAVDGLLSLRWNNHCSSFLQQLSYLRDKHTYSDLTLACGGRFYSVHKFVLSTCSDYFSDIIDNTPCRHPTIVLKDILTHDLEALLNYMYLGEVSVSQNELSGLIMAAECLRIKGLAVPDEHPSKLSEGSRGQSASDWGEGGTQVKRKRQDREERCVGSNKRRNSSLQHSEEWKENPHLEEFTDLGESDSVEAIPAPQAQREDGGVDSTTSAPNSSLQHEDKFVESVEVKVEKQEVVEHEEDSDLQLSDPCGGLAEQQEANSSSHCQDMGNRHEDDRVNFTSTGLSGTSVSSLLQQYTHPQSFEEVVTQALPGPSGVHGDTGQGWEGGHSKGELVSFAMDTIPPQQDALSPAQHSSLHQRGRGKSGWGQQSAHTSVLPAGSTGACHTAFRRRPAQRIDSAPYPDRHQVRDKLAASLDRGCCQICGYEGQDISQLRKHLRIHTGEKPYQCPACGYSSAQSSNLKVHIKRLHPELCQAGVPMENQQIFAIQ